MKKHAWYAQQVTRRFLEYVAVDTQSNRGSAEVPSTPGQLVLLGMIRKELGQLGIEDIAFYDDGYLLARIPASEGFDHVPCIGFMAHVDTAGDVSGRDVSPQVIRSYDGSDISLPGTDLVLRTQENPELLECIGKDIITTDGRTLLGADDKAGIAEIMAAAEYLTGHPELPHGPVELMFTSDEETGAGMDRFPVGELRSVCCVTLDGAGRGSLEAECFYAVRADIQCRGISYHLGDARGRMVNAVTMASSFISMLPQAESPESTDGRFGYYCALSISGDVEETAFQVYIRDFDRKEAQRRSETLTAIAGAVEAAFPGGTVSVKISWQYENMLEKIRENPQVLSVLEQAMRNMGIEPVHTSIRGGTDGARLTAMGIPTPNMFTGGYNYHSRYEWACVDTMAEAAGVVEEIILLWAKGK